MEDMSQASQTAQAARPRIGFYIHLTVFILTNALLVVINLLTTPERLWFQWPLAGWGLGILLHLGLILYLPRRTGGKQRRLAPELKKSRRGRRSYTN